MTTVTAKYLKERPAEVLGRVQYGNERVTITRYGREIAAVIPIEHARLLEELEDLVGIDDALKLVRELVWNGSVGLAEVRARLKD